MRRPQLLPARAVAVPHPLRSHYPATRQFILDRASAADTLQRAERGRARPGRGLRRVGRLVQAGRTEILVIRSAHCGWRRWPRRGRLEHHRERPAGCRHDHARARR